MKIYSPILLAFGLLSMFFSCDQKAVPTIIAKDDYFDPAASDTTRQEILIAVTDEEELQYGARVAYLNEKGDTIIPFGKYAYLGTDTLVHFANVMEFPNDSSYGQWVAIDQHQNRLYDLVTFDNGPDYFYEGLVRAKRNEKMGFANQYGQIVIPCTYAFAWSFEEGKAKVALNAKAIKDGEHTRVESDEWFFIDKKGQKIN
ncbi:MAG: WG repeat-containing protein [Aureispira sp.]